MECFLSEKRSHGPIKPPPPAKATNTTNTQHANAQSQSRMWRSRAHKKEFVVFKVKTKNSIPLHERNCYYLRRFLLGHFLHQRQRCRYFHLS